MIISEQLRLTRITWSYVSVNGFLYNSVHTAQITFNTKETFNTEEISACKNNYCIEATHVIEHLQLGGIDTEILLRGDYSNIPAISIFWPS